MAANGRLLEAIERTSELVGSLKTPVDMLSAVNYASTRSSAIMHMDAIWQAAVIGRQVEDLTVEEAQAVTEDVVAVAQLHHLKVFTGFR